MQKQAEWNSFKNILCIRPDNLGDVIMTSPAIRALKQDIPGRKITLLTSSAAEKVSRLLPEIDEIIKFDPPWVKNNFINAPEVISDLVDLLKQKKFDAAVIFTVYSQNPLPAAMICYQAGIERIAGYCRENPYHLMTDWIPDEEPISTVKHEVERQLDLVRFLNVQTLSDHLSVPKIDKEQLEKVYIKIESTGADPYDKFVILHPGVSESRRQFSAEKFAEASSMLFSQLGYQVFLTGVDSEKKLCESIRDAGGPGIYSLAGKLSMEEFISLISKAPLLISNNTGPVHIAASVQTPAVVLYALTNPQHTPWKAPGIVLPFAIPENQRSKNIIIKYAHEKCFRKTPKEITPQDIMDAASSLLHKTIKNTNEKVLTYI